MKFTVEVEDFWLDEEEELVPRLQEYVVDDVVRKIEKSITKKVDNLINNKIREIIDSKIEPLIEAELDRVVKIGKIKPRYSDEVTITKYIQDLFTQHNGWSPDRQVKHIAEEFAKDCKLQYNNAFANHIVQAMKEQGLLKDEVVQILLEKK